MKMELFADSVPKTAENFRYLELRVARLKFYELPKQGSKHPNIHCFQKLSSQGSIICNDIMYICPLLLSNVIMHTLS